MDRDEKINNARKRLVAAQFELKAAEGCLNEINNEPKCPHKDNPKIGDMFLVQGVRIVKLECGDGFVWIDRLQKALPRDGWLEHDDTTYIGNIKDKLHLLMLDEEKLAAALGHGCNLKPRTLSASAVAILEYLRDNQ